MTKEREDEIIMYYRISENMQYAIECAGFSSKSDIPAVDMGRIWARIQDES